MKFGWKSCLIACVSVFILFLAIQYWSSITTLLGTIAAAASTLLIGAGIAYVVNILMRFFEEKIAPNCQHPLWVKCRRSVCMLLAFLTLSVAIVLLLRLIVPQLVDCFDRLVAALVEAAPKVYTWLDERINLTELLREQNIVANLPSTSADWRALLEQYANILLTGVGGFMNLAVNLTTSLLGTVVTLFISLIFACNILAGKEQLGAQFDRLFTRIFGEKLMTGYRHVLEVLDSCFQSYIVGQLVEALILGGLCAVGMLILRLDYALMISALIGVSALIPVAGAYIGAAVGAIMLFSVDPVKAVIFLVFLVILQQFEGNVIYPRTVGAKLHLPGIWVLAAVTIGGGVMGIAGMLLFVPLTAAAYRLIGEWARREGTSSLVEKIAAIDDEETEQASLQEAVVAAAPVAAAAASQRKNNQQKNRRRRH